MILNLYMLSIAVAMMLYYIYLLLISYGIVKCDPFEAYEKLQKIIKEYPEFEKYVDFAMNNRSMCIMILCVCPFLNIITIIAIIRIILGKY